MRHWARRVPTCFLIILLVWAMSSFDARLAQAHDAWADGNPVPIWVRNSCCGPQDVHHLTAKQVHAMFDGWHVDGYKQVLPYGSEFPSQDGDYWIFYKDYPDGSQTQPSVFSPPSDLLVGTTWIAPSAAKFRNA
jgi:hypothetical protein